MTIFIYKSQLEEIVFHRSNGDDHHLQSLHTHTRATLSVPKTISPGMIKIIDTIHWLISTNLYYCLHSGHLEIIPIITKDTSFIVYSKFAQVSESLILNHYKFVKETSSSFSTPEIR